MPRPAPPPQPTPPARVVPPIPAPAKAPTPAPALQGPDPLEDLKARAYAALEGVSGESVFYIDKDIVLVGRASPADGIVPEVDLGSLPLAGSISRRHARLVRGGEEVLLEDLGSANGTFVNGERLVQGVQKPVFENDEVRFGAERFLFHWRRRSKLT